MVCPNCKLEYSEKDSHCLRCGRALNLPPNEEMKMLYPFDEKPKNNAFMINFGAAFGLTFASVFFMIIGIFVGIGICIIIWIVQLSMKKEGAHGWIAGTLTVPAIALLLFGACMALL